MTRRITRFELDTGEEIEIEVVEAAGGRAGTAEIGLGEDVPRRLSESLRKIQDVAVAVVEKLREASPGEIEVSFGVKLGGTTNMIISAGNAEANLNVKLKWGEGKKAS